MRCTVEPRFSHVGSARPGGRKTFVPEYQMNGMPNYFNQAGDLPLCGPACPLPACRLGPAASLLLEQFGSVICRWGGQNIFCCEFCRTRPTSSPNRRRGCFEGILSAAEVNLWRETQPEGSGPSIRHADATGVDKTLAADASIHLDVCMAADDELSGHRSQNPGQDRLWS